MMEDWRKRADLNERKSDPEIWDTLRKAFDFA